MFHAISKSNLVIFVLLLGAFVAFIGAPWVLSAAHDRGEWQATKGFLEVTQAPRITQYPGVIAWLRQLMRSQCNAEATADAQADCVNVLRPGPIPPRLRSLELFLAPSLPEARTALLLESKKAGRLCIAELELNDRRYVATQPALNSNCEAPPAGPLIDQAIALLDARPAPDRLTVEPFGNMEPVRAYVVAQDGTLISRRFSDQHLERSQRGAEYQEDSRVAESLGLPALGTVNSFFPLVRGAGYTYTGTYFDVSGLGVVATGMTQVTLPGVGEVVVAIDVALGTDWIEKIEAGPQLLPLDVPADGNAPASWAWVASQASSRDADDLAKLARRCTGQQRAFDTVAACTPIDEAEDGFLAAMLLGVSGRDRPVARWLIAWMPPPQASFELAHYLPAMLLALAAIAYALRDRQYRALSTNSASQTRQWTQLVDSIGTAMIVIDPNTDRVRFHNAPARQLGIEPSQVFRELVHAEDRRAYDEFNLAAGGAERAYAVRLQLQANASQWAIVRSTTLAGPLPILGARESDRLGVMSLLSANEMERLRASLELSAIYEERGKLSSLITHGMGHLTRMMASDRTFDEQDRHWLRLYLLRRVNVIADLLSGWSLPLDEVRRDELAIAKPTVQSALDAFQRLATGVAGNRDLRLSLQWGNGVLSRLAPGTAPFRFDLQGWSDDLNLMTRIDGAETFVFDELLINAFKHGKPGCPPRLTARVIRSTDRRWIEFELRNEVRSTREARVGGADHRYGGQAMIQEVCRRLRWEFLQPELQGEVYIVRWRARSIEAAEDLKDEGLDAQ
jgi:PAS domain-containing protein